MSERVRLKCDDAGVWWLSYRRYGRLHWINTGTSDRDEAEDMAAERARALVKEQTQKALRRPDWRPDGVETAKPTIPAASAGSFDASLGGRFRLVSR